MTNELDAKLAFLKEIEARLETLSTEKETVRKEVFELMKAENIGQYKNEIATISKVERKTIKYNITTEEVLENLEKQKLVKYFTVIPEQVIAEHKELNQQFEKDVKEGVFTLEGIEVKVTESPAIRFNK